MSDPLLGTDVGRYRIERLLGEGGMGAVYLAEQPTIGSRVAIKVLSQECARSPELLERFFAEARSVNLIRHENIVSVLDLAQLSDGRPYIVMEFIEGQTLGLSVDADEDELVENGHLHQHETAIARPERQFRDPVPNANAERVENLSLGPDSRRVCERLAGAVVVPDHHGHRPVRIGDDRRLIERRGRDDRRGDRSFRNRRWRKLRHRQRGRE